MKTSNPVGKPEVKRQPLPFQPITFERPLTWQQFILDALIRTPSRIFSEADRTAWLNAKLSSMARMTKGRLETPADVASRLDAQQWRRAGSHAPRIEKQVTSGESQPVASVEAEPELI